MKLLNLSVASRTETGKGPNRRLRATGRVPAVIYGDKGADPLKVSLDAHSFSVAIRGLEPENTFFSVEGELIKAQAGEFVCVPREIQRDPVTRAVLHVDLYKLDMAAESNFEVPILHTGNPVGVKAGGFLEQHLHHLSIRCIPMNVPGAIRIDLSGLEIGVPVHVSELTIPEGVKVVNNPDTVVFSIMLPIEEETLATDETAATEETAAEPEVIGRKKKEDEEAD